MICQILGLTGVDLFSPSDVVEKRDVRRVCMCIRSFSKKARSKNLNVPDFDIVTYTIVMPTDLVGGIRRNLEQSQYSSSSSNGCSSSPVDLRELYRQKSLGAQSPLHYDSFSESDESESASTEFEFKSPLSNVSYHAANFFNIIGQESPESSSVIDGDVPGFHTQFRLEAQGRIEDRPSIQSSNHELKMMLHHKLSSSDTESQIDQSAEEDFIRSSSAPWRKGLENDLAGCLSCDMTVDHPKEELMNAFIGSSSKVQMVSHGPADDGVRQEYMESSNRNNILKFQDVVQEKTSEMVVVVNAVGKKEKNCTGTFQMDPSNSVDDEVSSAGNYTKLLVDASDFKFSSANDGSNRKMMDLEKNGMQNASSVQDADEVEIALVYSNPISWEDKYATNDYAVSAFHFAPAGSSKDVDACDPIIVISAKDHVSTLDKEAIYINDDGESFTDGRHSFRIETGTSGTVPPVCFDNYTCDNGRPYAGRKFQDMNSNRTSSLAAGREILSLKNSDNRQVDTDVLTISCLDPGSVKNGQILSRQLDKFSGSLNMQCRDCFNINPKANERMVCSSKDCCTLEKGDQNDAFTCELEMDADEQVNNPRISTMDEDMMSSILIIGERKIRRSTTLDAYENQLMAVPSTSLAEGSMEIKISEKKEDTSYPSYDAYKNPPGGVESNCTEKLSILGSSAADLKIPQVKFLHASGREPLEQISAPKVDGVVDREVPTPARIMEAEPYAEEDSDINNKGEALVMDDVSALKEHEEGNPRAKAKERAKGSKVLKSLAGAMTLLGALFIVHRVRQRREKENNAGFAAPQQDNTPSQELAKRKRAENAKAAVLYPGEKLKF